MTCTSHATPRHVSIDHSHAASSLCNDANCKPLALTFDQSKALAPCNDRNATAIAPSLSLAGKVVDLLYPMLLQSTRHQGRQRVAAKTCGSYNSVL